MWVLEHGDTESPHWFRLQINAFTSSENVCVEIRMYFQKHHYSQEIKPSKCVSVPSKGYMTQYSSDTSHKNAIQLC